MLGIGLAPAGAVAAAAERPVNGQAVYRRWCVNCHGKEGEGVKDKYNGALQGDWTLEKLAHYIDRKMPDDDPGKCAGPQAEAVARYIYGEFYSREARARKHPARVELARLTNRQYVLVVADLLQQFQGPVAAVKETRGLRATYYSSRNTRREEQMARTVRPVSPLPRLQPQR